MSEPSNHPAGEIFAQWSLYDTIIRFNYMCHREMIAAVQSGASRCEGALDVLDLGCGDGWMAGSGLEGREITQYNGIDLSESALEIARSRLQPRATESQFVQGDIAEIDRIAPDLSINLAIASYSLHHLQRPQLDHTIKGVADRLRPGGVFLWYDLELATDQTRDSYIERLGIEIAQQWTQLSPEQVADALDHLRDADWPVHEATKHELAESTGLRQVAVQWQNEFYAARVFVKS